MEQTKSADAAGRRSVLNVPAYRLGDLALFLVLAWSAVMNAAVAFQDARAGDAPASLHHLAAAVAIGLNAILFLLRGPAVVRGEGWLPKAMALVGSWMAPPLALLPLTWEPAWLLNATTIALILAYAFVVWALLTLRNSFSVFPEARQLVRAGPYGLVRHPLYAAYIVSYVALMLPRMSVAAVLLAAAGIGGEMLRARYEERLLTQVFPEYEGYAAQTPRFVPAVLMPWRARADR